MASKYAAALRAHLEREALSPSHSLKHLDQVLSFALDLQRTYGGDGDVITAAALLHDLGRGNPQLRGATSAGLSALLAEGILRTIGFPKEKLAAVLTAIEEHDQPHLRPSTVEGRILKDADFLAGFGAVGIVRSAMWTGETGGSLPDLIERLEQKMPLRIQSLEFEQSRRHAARDYVFTRLFLDKLVQPQSLTRLPLSPYIVIEGVSGAGKTTQTELLAQHFRDIGCEPLMVREPSTWYLGARRELGIERDELDAQAVLLFADRYLSARNIIEQGQARGSPVISDRSYLSTMVYQSDGGWLSPANIAYLHTAMPQPTDIFILDVSPREALQRISARLAEKRTARGEHETLQQLTQHQEGFLTLRRYFPFLNIIPTDSASPEAVHDQIWARLADRIDHCVPASR